MSIIRTYGLLICLISTPAWSLPCNNINKGETWLSVVKKCGEPDEIHSFHPSFLLGYGIADGDEMHSHHQIVIDEWLYDAGARAAVYRVRFENGVVVNVYGVPRARE